MIPMTTHNLGEQPGRARLGACGLRSARRPHRMRADWSRCWHRATLVSLVDTTNFGTMPYVGSSAVETGIGSVKRPARHLGTRST